MTLTLCDGIAFCSYCSPRLVLIQIALAMEEDERVLGPFDVVFVTTVWSSLGKLNCVCVKVVRLCRLWRLRFRLWDRLGD